MSGNRSVSGCTFGLSSFLIRLYMGFESREKSNFFLMKSDSEEFLSSCWFELSTLHLLPLSAGNLNTAEFRMPESFSFFAHTKLISLSRFSRANAKGYLAGNVAVTCFKVSSRTEPCKVPFFVSRQVSPPPTRLVVLLKARLSWSFRYCCRLLPEVIVVL